MSAILAWLNHWLERIDPGAHRRIKGLRLVTAYGLAEALGTLKDISIDVPAGMAVGALAGNIALWASVSEARSSRWQSSRDLMLLCLACALGAATFALSAPWLQLHGQAWPKIVLVAGAFLAGYLRRYGVSGAGIGSQIYIGQLLACNAQLTPGDLPAIGIAVLIAMLSAMVPRLLSGPAERPVLSPALPPTASRFRALSMPWALGLQAAVPSIIVVGLDATVGLLESVWAITACVYVVAGSAGGTRLRIRHRIVGTLIGVPLGLACLPLAQHEPMLLWSAASLAMIVYAMALPERYDVACAAFAFALMVTMAVSGEHSVTVLLARAWETALGCALAMAAAMVLFPLRDKTKDKRAAEVSPPKVR
ncbi:MAG TPA: FUSC family protein [Dyella sp.]|uniref:FUSC family protein n=1 Tax=Dyella sp. TaxID=1869338 RepID=UPI002D79FD67|nr:FUSC family protein [Dyella sp.]HET6554217.1 FUSC family protein [Dyella sp.]